MHSLCIFFVAFKTKWTFPYNTIFHHGCYCETLSQSMLLLVPWIPLFLVWFNEQLLTIYFFIVAFTVNPSLIPRSFLALEYVFILLWWSQWTFTYNRIFHHGFNCETFSYSVVLLGPWIHRRQRFVVGLPQCVDSWHFISSEAKNHEITPVLPRK